MGDAKIKKSSKFPPNVSADYYTDPVYSSDGFYGYEHHQSTEEKNLNQKAHDGSPDAVDEPVESWGWVNNTDKVHY